MNKQNILLLALSTFRKIKNESDKSIERNIGSPHSFQYKTKDGEILQVNGYYQLEPIPNLLIERGIPLDAVILLATKETKEIVEVTLADDIVETSALDYFSGWIEEQFQGAFGRSPKCIPVDVDEIMPAQAVRSTVEKLQELQQNGEINLYIDTHGGFRSVQLIVEAIVNLLRDEKLELHVYNVHFGEGDSANTIVRDEAIRIFDFVSGINEFMNYGRIDSLLKFIDKDKNQELIAPIQEISEGISWCDIGKFEAGLRKLKNYYKSPKRQINNEYLKIFEERIRNDYGELIEEKSVDDAVEMVRWCLKKGFYQQALTLIEAKVPESLSLKKNIFTLTAEGEVFRKSNALYRSTNELTIADVFNGCIGSLGSWLSCWRKKGNWNQPSEPNRRNFNSIFAKSDMSFSDRTEKVYALLGYWLRDISCRDVLEEHELCYIGSDVEKKEIECSSAIQFNKKDDEDWCKYLVILLVLHRTLKEERNQANHAVEKDLYESTAIGHAISYYLELVDRVTIP